eukprot:TRINITY_DN1864_c0_g2_i7.p1 TRINITY_DN1864_c0_g2~~TRINITY_DN1864_c0_g2_i7.p1  ORF type:complete len:997 (+),score=162.26 TRINITY_DN1864_c0_g2_i7:253-3243(+)
MTERVSLAAVSENDKEKGKDAKLKRAHSEGHLTANGVADGLAAAAAAGASSSSTDIKRRSAWKTKLFPSRKTTGPSSPQTLNLSELPTTSPSIPAPFRVPFGQFNVDPNDINNLYQTLPKLKIPNGGLRQYDPATSITLFSPDSGYWEYGYSIDDDLSCYSTSTYPGMPGKKDRDGDPIADRFVIQVQNAGELIVVALADGCNWGAPAREAATLASKAFVSYINLNQHLITDAPTAGYHLLSAFAEANDRISEGFTDISKCGTTTLVGSLIIPLAKQEKYAIVSCQVGDCKVYHYSTGSNKVKDLTEGNRECATNGSDPGGRLGPAKETAPDLRNLKVTITFAKKTDLVLFCTDGIADNIDARHQGLTPKDLHLDKEDWSQQGDAAEDEAQSKYTEQYLRDNVFGPAKNSKNCKSPSTNQVVSTLITHCLKVTHTSREWMVAHPNKRLPKDYKTYQGKMDHATCIAVRLNSFRKPPVIKSTGSLPIFRKLRANEETEQTSYCQVSTQHYCSSFVHAHPGWISNNFHPSSACLHNPLPQWRLASLESITPKSSPRPSMSSLGSLSQSGSSIPTSSSDSLPSVSITSAGVEFNSPTSDDGNQLSLKDIFSGASTSTLPLMPGKVKREGFPICDQLHVELRRQPSIIFSLADASTWGKAAREAVNRAITGFKLRLENEIKNETDFPQIGQVLIESIHFIHQRITEGKSDIWEAGTTSFLGGVIVPIDAASQIGSFVPQSSVEVAQLPTWAILFANVGTCKVFHYSAALGKIKNLTGSVYTAFESLARLGPSYKPTGQSDLRNLALHATCASVGDIILALSDGFTDNLHPQFYGYTPRHFSLPVDDWAVDQSDPVEKEIISSFQEKLLERLIHNEAVTAPLIAPNANRVHIEMKPSINLLPTANSGELVEPLNVRNSLKDSFSPEEIVTRLIDHTLQLTKQGREYFSEKAQKQLPKNFVTLTGKMDHATVVALKLPSIEKYHEVVNAEELQIVQREIVIP